MKQICLALESEKQMKEKLLEKLAELENIINDRQKENKLLSDQNDMIKKEFDDLNWRYSTLESKFDETSQKLSWMSISKESIEQIKQKMTEMIAEKNSLAYENGVAQNKILQLEEELEEVNKIRVGSKFFISSNH